MKLLILDGNSVINRAFYGIHDMTTKDGVHTNAVFGFLNILQRMEAEEKPDAVCVAFDLHGPTFRHLQYDGYKATRHGMPEELAQQMPIMKEILNAMNIPIYECQGWEADDVIGTVGKICGQENWDCVIVTGDRDSLQLIDGHVNVKLVISKAGRTEATLYDEAQFQAEYGFEPQRLIDLKALMGDSSDNIPGIAGVGPKTAKDLLYKFGTLDGVYENLQDASIRPKLREKLENGKDNAYLSYDLATIRCMTYSCGWNFPNSSTATVCGKRRFRQSVRAGSKSCLYAVSFPQQGQNARLILPRMGQFPLRGSRAFAALRLWSEQRRWRRFWKRELQKSATI